MKVWILCYWLAMLALSIRILSEQWLLTRKTLHDFWSDAFLKDGRAGGRSLAQEFALSVFGEPDTHWWMRILYAVSAFCSYFSFACFMFVACLHAEGVTSIFVSIAVLFVISLAMLVTTGTLLLRFTIKSGRLKERVADFRSRHDLALWRYAQSGEPSELPRWWLYGVSTSDTVFRLLESAWPFVLLFLALAGFAFGFLSWVGAKPSFLAGTSWFILLLWMLIGWIMPMDGLVKLATWKGDGKFSEVLLRNAAQKFWME
ncbi:hypothetical protein [Acidithiobacillus acidisediminis]|uniref:hypothetical protein n=1 Tax=Acidithiobacillus acidisediminis TaxID=2937799 RepID=UPI00200CD4FD|nr:hypothetical protein [Acidithiobacillus sp. S30A2]